jgi:outer membrane protein assembly factor BamB
MKNLPVLTATLRRALGLSTVALCPAVLWAALAMPSSAADWMQFRGPGGSASSEETGLPVTWSDDENLVWKTKLPGLGSSCPVTVGERIFLTCYSGYGESQEDPGEQKDLMRHVVCLDRKTGKIAWQKDLEPQLPESQYGTGNNGWHGYATSTPASDGQRVYVFFGRSGVYCFDLAGKELWHADVGSRTNGWGSGTSPVLYENLVIVNASVESGSLVALNKMTGKQVWQAAGVRGAWNSPVLVESPGGKTEVVLSLPGNPLGKLVGYDADDGKELWRCDGIQDGGYVCPTVIAHKGVVYAIGGRRNTAVAVKAGGRGEVEELWRANKGSNVCSPVYHDGHLYWLHDRQGTAYCLNAETGKVVYEERLRVRPGVVYASGIVADGKLYYVSQHSGTLVLAAKPKLELLATNKFEDDARTNASPVVDNGRLLIRSDKYLYCVGAK